ncbi:vitamin B12-dependent ribonucleotide reductase [Clostridium hydrogenum]|uniref:vitamin B12-dependent ribonucleotide reductase n=1 Tax=Clostridium hydrogenum TaxID=2855764 RepID=UPI001F253077|nr:vitamin B12-dependent ribonucleotide reductase [Clostridium hydrogenum]
MNIKDTLFKRFYTRQLENNEDKTVYDLFTWKKVDVFMKDHKTGKILIDMKDLEFPSSYSQNACDIIASKYFRKAGIPNETHYENSLKMVAHRLVSFWCESLKDEGIIENDVDKKIFYDELVFAFLNQMYAPNSPQWFNTGLSLIYGITGNDQGNFYYDSNLKKVIKSKDAFSRTQASACFILSIEDKLLGNHSISEQYVTETKLFKGGSGTGTNFSSIRAKGEKLSGGGVSSGLMSFLRGLDRNAGAIKSGGTTRRAAKMLCLNVDHPEIMDYITWKAKEEDKVRALGKMGYDASFEGEAYETVSGQNGNNSVMLSNEFMKKVSNLDINQDETIELKGRIDSSVNKKIKVKDIWEAINKSAWRCADPAPLFSDRLNAWHTCPCGEDGIYNTPYNRINSTNPCGEYAFLDDTSCNLASINLYKFYDDKNKTFDIDGYKHIIGLVQLVLEASINFGHFPTEDIARKTYMFRSTGLGVSNLASLLMVMGYPYDSEEGRTIASALIGILTGYSYYISSLMAEKIKPFEKYDTNKKYMLKVIRNHARAAGALTTPFENLDYDPIKVNHSLLKNMNFEYISDCLKGVWTDALSCGEKFGYRNAQVSVIAPTGTISFAMDCSATSIEPFFSHVIYKKLSGGGYMTITNPLIEKSLENLGYPKNEIKAILDYILRKTITTDKNGFEYEAIADGKLEGAPYLKEEHLPIFDTANKCGSGNRYISPMGHVLMVASIIPLISGSISKTVNLPKNASISDFKNVILTSWKLGIKGITLYRDSSKESQPLNTSLKEDDHVQLEDMTYNELLNKVKNLKAPIKYANREKPVGIRRGTTHPAQIDDVKIYTTVNRRENGEISEIYITTDREGTIIMGLLNSLSKALSVMLQYHVPAQDISKMLRGQKYEPYGFVKKHPYIKSVTSISDLVSKIIDIELGDFSRCQVKPEGYSVSIKEKNTDERVYTMTCGNCSSTRMVRNGTCYVCLDCGSTTGCS